MAFAVPLHDVTGYIRGVFMEPAVGIEPTTDGLQNRQLAIQALQWEIS